MTLLHKAPLRGGTRNRRHRNERSFRYGGRCGTGTMLPDTGLQLKSSASSTADSECDQAIAQPGGVRRFSSKKESDCLQARTEPRGSHRKAAVGSAMRPPFRCACCRGGCPSRWGPCSASRRWIKRSPRYVKPEIANTDQGQNIEADATHNSSEFYRISIECPYQKIQSWR